MSQIIEKPPVCMTIAGLDPSGGAGVVADVSAFSRFGCFPSMVITSVTFQNTTGVFGADNLSAESVQRQADAVFDDYEIAALKTGMLPTAEIIKTVADLVKRRSVENFVIDPVVRSTSGYDLIDDDALRALVAELFPLALIATPNLAEAERITGISIETPSDLERAAAAMLETGVRYVLIKGGHRIKTDVDSDIARDHLFSRAGTQAFEAEFIETTATHGTGCVLSAAITANLALGHSVENSVRTAKEFVTNAIRNAPMLGHGHSPIGI
ncbi:MAG: bifunctional hydroxymethylpyrimidine kinase/phosphomethylpyrimidine kinase [Acidobacteria bacterium]|nr:bifunctional hydroxymethylpyrimidine kinase/phosphomethylpyrimidine kinase [Acidobacteriota bacterium]